MEFVPLWTDIIDGPNWKILDLPGDLYRFWTFCLIAAQKHDHVDGWLPDERTLARWFGMDRDATVTCRDRLVTAGLIDRDGELFRVHDWTEWRAVKDAGATSRKRKQRHKEKQLKDSSRDGHAEVTATSQNVTPQNLRITESQNTITHTKSRDVCVTLGGGSEELEPFEPGPTASPIKSTLPPDKQRVLDRQVERWGASNGDRIVGDLLKDYEARIVEAACDEHYYRNNGVLAPERLTGICRAMAAGTWKIPAKKPGPENQPAKTSEAELARIRDELAKLPKMDPKDFEGGKRERVRA